MKGMELPVSLIVVFTITALILVTIAFFLNTATTPSIGRTDMERLFYTKCDSYAQNKCDWSVTREPDFSQFVDACRVMFGDNSEKFSCLYNHCQACKKVSSSQEMTCFTLCEEARSNKQLGVDHVPACNEIREQCAEISTCVDVCG